MARSPNQGYHPLDEGRYGVSHQPSPAGPPVPGEQTCPSCNEVLPGQFRFCGYCGSPLARREPARKTRKTVTVLFCDLKGSTPLGEALDSESLRELIARYFEDMCEVLERHGGTVEKFIGDAVMAIFGLRKVHEDDALRAVRAAGEMAQKLTTLNEELARRWGVTLTNRTGVNTGEVVAGEMTPGRVVGDVLNTAARLEAAAPPMGVLIGESTYRLVREAVEVEQVEPLTLKGKAEPVPAYRLVSVTEVATRRHDRPLVGREAELEHLQREFHTAVEDQAARMVTVLGQPGVGKSRLIEEFMSAVEGQALVLRGRCLSYGRGITFWPLLEAIQQAASITDEDAPELARTKLAGLAGEGGEDAVARVASAIGLSEEQFPVGEVLWGARKLLEAIAARQPLVVIFEDIHWAELTFLDLIEHVNESGQGPIVLLCLARRDLLDLREDWAQEARASQISLEPLSDADIERIVETVLGTDGLAEGARAMIVEAAGGNPLFVEQMLSMMIDEGLLRHEHGRWLPAGSLDELSVPPSINALITARLDHLQHEERAVIEPASVVGVVFPQPAVEELVTADLRNQVGVRLSSLSTKQLITPIGADAVSGDSFRFDHILIRDATYNALLKRERASLHEHFAEWGERVNRESGRESEFEEIVGYHLEQAHHYLAELGPLDEHGQALGARGAAKLAAAGRRAFGRGDMPAAANLLRRAVGLLPRHDPARAELLPELGEALMDVGEFVVAQTFLDEAVETAAQSGDERLGARAILGLLLLKTYSWEVSSEQVALEAEEALAIFQELGDDAGIAAANLLLAWAHGTAHRCEASAEAAQRAMDHAVLAGDERQRRLAAAHYAQVSLYGPTPVPEAVERCERILEQASGDRRTQGIVMCLLARLESMRGNFERARSLYTQGRLTLEEMGRSVLSSSTSLDAYHVEMLVGDPAAAERELRRDYDVLTEMGEKTLLSTLAGQLAHAVYAQGRYDEADRFSREAEELTAEDDLSSQTLWRSARAKVLARRGRLAEARTLAQDAVALQRRSEELGAHADALMDLAEVLYLARRPDEAQTALEEARGLLERKGDLVSIARVDALAGSLSAEPTEASAS